MLNQTAVASQPHPHHGNGHPVIKLCCQCKHFKPNAAVSAPKSRVSLGRCAHPSTAKVDLVSGETTYEYAAVIRMLGAPCAPEAKLHEAPEAKLHEAPESPAEEEALLIRGREEPDADALREAARISCAVCVAVILLSLGHRLL
jgi:hypothetical protein